MLCGQPEVDLEVLKKATVYEAVSPTDRCSRIYKPILMMTIPNDDGGGGGGQSCDPFLGCSGGAEQRRISRTDQLLQREKVRTHTHAHIYLHSYISTYIHLPHTYTYIPNYLNLSCTYEHTYYPVYVYMHV